MAHGGFFLLLAALSGVAGLVIALLARPLGDVLKG